MSFSDSGASGTILGSGCCCMLASGSIGTIAGGNEIVCDCGRNFRGPIVGASRAQTLIFSRKKGGTLVLALRGGMSIVSSRGRVVGTTVNSSKACTLIAATSDCMTRIDICGGGSGLVCR